MKKFDNIFEQAREIIRQQWTLQDLRREAPCRQQEQHCQHAPADKAHIQATPRLGVLLRAQKLRDQNTGNRADCARHHRENKCKITT